MRRLALTYSVTVTLVFQKRYFLRDLRLQIVCSGADTVGDAADGRQSMRNASFGGQVLSAAIAKNRMGNASLARM